MIKKEFKPINFTAFALKTLEHIRGITTKQVSSCVSEGKIS